jgi:hypothetical protein
VTSLQLAFDWRRSTWKWTHHHQQQAWSNHRKKTKTMQKQCENDRNTTRTKNILKQTNNDKNNNNYTPCCPTPTHWLVVAVVGLWVHPIVRPSTRKKRVRLLLLVEVGGLGKQQQQWEGNNEKTMGKTINVTKKQQWYNNEKTTRKQQCETNDEKQRNQRNASNNEKRNNVEW